MNENTTQQIDRISDAVGAYLKKNSHLIPGAWGESVANHVQRIGTSIICTQYDIGPAGGSFVKAVVDNNLSQAVAFADNINIHALRFYVTMLNCMEVPQ